MADIGAQLDTRFTERILHTCLHGGGVKMIHLKVAVDETGRRCTDRLWNVPPVDEMYQTWEAKQSPSGTKFSFYYSIKSNVPIAGGIAKAFFVRSCRQHAERDVQGLKALCEAELLATQAAGDALAQTRDST
jgi:hypothetical protein